MHENHTYIPRRRRYQNTIPRFMIHDSRQPLNYRPGPPCTLKFVRVSISISLYRYPSLVYHWQLLLWLRVTSAYSLLRERCPLPADIDSVCDWMHMAGRTALQRVFCCRSSFLPSFLPMRFQPSRGFWKDNIMWQPTEQVHVFPDAVMAYYGLLFLVPYSLLLIPHSPARCKCIHSADSRLHTQLGRIRHYDNSAPISS